MQHNSKPIAGKIKSMQGSSSAVPTIAILAGGLATRLRPITERIPKALVEVAGEPFICHQLRLLAREGMCDVVLCVGHLGEMIEEEIGAEACGCRIRYSRDGERALGTGGALRKALPLLGDAFFVMYGDSYLDIAFPPIWDAFVQGGLSALMTVFHNEGRWDTSNVEFVDGQVKRYGKAATPAMVYIDYGLGVLSQGAVARMPTDAPADLADLYRDLAAEGSLAGYEVTRRFYEIGSLAGLEETAIYLGVRS